PPVVAGRDVRRPEDALRVDRAVDAVDAAALDQLRDVHGDVEADQELGHPGARALEARALDPAGHTLHALGLARVLGTPDPDGRHRHALRADRAAALRAG